MLAITAVAWDLLRTLLGVLCKTVPSSTSVVSSSTLSFLLISRLWPRKFGRPCVALCLVLGWSLWLIAPSPSSLCSRGTLPLSRGLHLRLRVCSRCWVRFGFAPHLVCLPFPSAPPLWLVVTMVKLACVLRVPRLHIGTGLLLPRRVPFALVAFLPLSTSWVGPMVLGVLWPPLPFVDFAASRRVRGCPLPPLLRQVAKVALLWRPSRCRRSRAAHMLMLSSHRHEAHPEFSAKAYQVKCRAGRAARTSAIAKRRITMRNTAAARRKCSGRDLEHQG